MKDSQLRLTAGRQAHGPPVLGAIVHQQVLYKTYNRRHRAKKAAEKCEKDIKAKEAASGASARPQNPGGYRKPRE
jgi:hypothetical protein